MLGAIDTTQRTMGYALLGVLGFAVFLLAKDALELR